MDVGHGPTVPWFVNVVCVKPTMLYPGYAQGKPCGAPIHTGFRIPGSKILLMKRRKPRPSAPESREVTLESLRQNAILAGLAGADAQSLVERGSIVDLPLREQIYEPNERINHVYFPLDCVLSVVTTMKD